MGNPLSKFAKLEEPADRSSDESDGPNISKSEQFEVNNNATLKHLQEKVYLARDNIMCIAYIADYSIMINMQRAFKYKLGYEFLDSDEFWLKKIDLQYPV